jgi:parallel beta-helix repeat protein
LAKSGAETLACNTIPDQTDGSFAFELLGSHDTVQYITVNDCEYGVESGFETETRNNAIWGNWFNGDYQSIENYIGYASEITGNKISNSVYPLISYGGIDDVITGNTIEGDGTFNQDGIVAVFGVGSRIESNTVTGASAGLDFGPDPEEGGPGYNSFAFVSCNRFDDNGVGIAIVYNNSGNTFEKNYADGNEEFGIASDNTSGADAIPNSGPNKFLSNHASGNGAEDYLDATAPYTGTNSGTNDGTADYYKGNKGNTASPAAIL